MGKIASELLVERLIDWGVDTVFGLPGDGINGIMEGFRRHSDKIKFILVHHEEAAAFMATGHAKATGQLGVCVATSGPGGIHLLNGLYDAKLDHQPVLAITGMQATSVLGTGYQQEVNLPALFHDVAAYNMMIDVPVSIPGIVDVAVRTSLSSRTVSHLTFPVDMQEAPADEQPYSGGLGTARVPASAPVYFPPPGTPNSQQLEAAAEALNRGKRIAMFVGAGALGARQEVLNVAARLNAPIVKTLPGKAVVPDDSEYTTGGLGLLGTKPSEEVMENCDTLLMVGCSFPYTAYLPSPDVTTVQIDNDPVRAGNRMPTIAPLVGDAKQTLAALLPMLKQNESRGLLVSAQDAMNTWRHDMRALESIESDPIQPQALIGAIDRLAADDAILTCDTGSVTAFAARHWSIRGGREFYVSGNLATMAPALPYAIATQMANPGRQIVALVGDGGMAMLMAEMLTITRNELPIKVFVMNNGLLGQILWEQMLLGYPEYGVRWERHADFTSWAESCGALGIRVEKPGDLEAAVQDAFDHNGATLVDCVVNADEPPMPGKVTHEQAMGFAKSFLKGEYKRPGILSTIARDKFTTLTASNKDNETSER